VFPNSDVMNSLFYFLASQLRAPTGQSATWVFFLDSTQHLLNFENAALPSPRNRALSRGVEVFPVSRPWRGGCRPRSGTTPNFWHSRDPTPFPPSSRYRTYLSSRSTASNHPSENNYRKDKKAFAFQAHIQRQTFRVYQGRRIFALWLRRFSFPPGFSLSFFCRVKTETYNQNGKTIHAPDTTESVVPP